MSQNIYIKRGTQAQIDGGALAAGEMALATDTGRVYIGDGVAIKVVGKAIIDTIGNRPTAKYAGLFFYATDEAKLYIDDGNAWNLISGSGGNTEMEVTQWGEDDTDPATNATIWSAQQVIRFSGISDTAVWFSFEKPSHWLNTSDITFRLNYAITTTASAGDKISLNMKYCVVIDGETPDFDTPDATVEDEMDVGSGVGNQNEYLDLTNIKIASAHISANPCRIIAKLWRDINGAAQNYPDNLDMISLIAKTS